MQNTENRHYTINSIDRNKKLCYDDSDGVNAQMRIDPFFYKVTDTGLCPIAGMMTSVKSEIFSRNVVVLIQG